MLVDQEAIEAIDKIRKFIHSKNSNVKNPYPDARIDNSIMGYFRIDAYDWTVFNYYIMGKKAILVSKQHVQHEGECKKYLNKEVLRI